MWITWHWYIWFARYNLHEKLLVRCYCFYSTIFNNSQTWTILFSNWCPFPIIELYQRLDNARPNHLSNIFHSTTNLVANSIWQPTFWKFCYKFIIEQNKRQFWRPSSLFWWKDNSIEWGMIEFSGEVYNHNIFK